MLNDVRLKTLELFPTRQDANSSKIGHRHVSWWGYPPFAIRVHPY